MKISALVVAFTCFGLSVYSQSAKMQSLPNPVKKLIVAQASCGQCRFNLPGKGCDLAVRINGKAFFVDGTSIDEHGDAHAEDGFCNSIRKAEVQGKVVKNRFRATNFKLLENEQPITPAKKTE